MTITLDDLIERQAGILAEIENLNAEELEYFANSPLPEDAVSSEIRKGRKLLRGLLRTRYVGNDDLKICVTRSNKSDFIPSPPGLFSIDLLPLPEGGFDRRRIMKTPVIGWEIDSGGEAKPVIPGPPMDDRWAVLTSTGFVIVDEWTRLGCGFQIPLKDWIRSEIEWIEEGEPFDFWTASQKAFEYSGPLPRAIWFMMAGSRDWRGTPEELLGALSKFRDHRTYRPSDPDSLAEVLDAEALQELRAVGLSEETLEAPFRDHTCAPDWPSDSASLAEALEELQSVLASVGLLIAHIDDGRLLITRVRGDGADNVSFLFQG